jgi:hypothetical protein
VYSSRARTGVSRLALPVALIVILVFAGAYVFLTRNSTTPPASSSSGSLPSAPVSSAVNQLVKDLNDRNVDGVVTFYGPNAVDVWSGRLVGLQGQYTGAGNIRLLYATTVGKSSQVNANVSKYAEDTFSPTHINATFELGMFANSTAAGVVRAIIQVSQDWSWGNGGWQISKENWGYTYYDSSLVDAGLPSATTFPQWGYMLKGGNPNLVSEKSLEWHAAPFLAAGVYAFLFSIVFVLAVRLRSSDRGARPEGMRKQSASRLGTDSHSRRADVGAA